MAWHRSWLVFLVWLVVLPAQAQDDASTRLKAQLARVQTLRAQRPGDGLLVYYEAMTLANLGEKVQALTAFRSRLTCLQKSRSACLSAAGKVALLSDCVRNVTGPASGVSMPSSYLLTLTLYWPGSAGCPRSASPNN